ALPEGRGFSLLADLGWIILATTVGGILLIGAFLAHDGRRIVQENTWHRQATVDPLTGLSNRRAFDEAALRYFSYAKRHQQPLSVLVVDCDFFKKVNDRYGHDAGDKVLVKLAAILREGVRTDDVVARFGGEEFVILLPGTGPEDAKGVGEKLRRLVEEASVTEGRSTITFTVSIGVSGHAGTHESMVGLLRTADAALYAAKENGRNRVEVMLPDIVTSESGKPRAASSEVA
ncbi:GGDEF domain-containing protein, partial [Caenispirillum bisanense]